MRRVPRRRGLGIVVRAAAWTRLAVIGRQRRLILRDVEGQEGARELGVHVAHEVGQGEAFGNEVAAQRTYIDRVVARVVVGPAGQGVVDQITRLFAVGVGRPELHVVQPAPFGDEAALERGAGDLVVNIVAGEREVVGVEVRVLELTLVQAADQLAAIVEVDRGTGHAVADQLDVGAVGLVHAQDDIAVLSARVTL